MSENRSNAVEDAACAPGAAQVWDDACFDHWAVEVCAGASTEQLKAIGRGALMDFGAKACKVPGLEHDLEKCRALIDTLLIEAAALENLVWQVAPENRPAGMNSAANALRATILEARQRQVKRK